MDRLMREMSADDRYDHAQRYLKKMFPCGLMGGQLQSMRKYEGRMGKRCMLNEDQMLGRAEIHFGSGNRTADDYLQLITCGTLDEYITINIEHADTETRRKEDFEYVCGVPLDIDIHSGGIDTEDMVSESIQRFMRLFPEPTIMIHSGRGMGVHYRYREPLSMTEWDLHHALWGKICDIVKNEIGVEIAEIDTHVGDAPRVMRIPGTYNNKAGAYCYIIDDDGPYYTMESLAEAFSIELESVRSEIENKPPKRRTNPKAKDKTHKKNNPQSKNKASKHISSDTSKKDHKSSSDTHPSIPEAHGVNRIIKQHYKAALEKLLYIRDDWIGNREMYCHIYFNICAVLEPFEEAVDDLLKQYSVLKERSTGDSDDGEIQHIIDQYHASNGDLLAYDYRSVDTIVKKLHMTDDEIKSTGLGTSIYSHRAAIQAQKNNEIRDSKRNLIKKLFADGIKQKDISDIVNKELDLLGTDYECNLAYVQRYTRGIRKQKDYTNQCSNTAYVHKKSLQDFAVQKKKASGGDGRYKECHQEQSLSDKFLPFTSFEHGDTINDAWDEYKHGNSFTVLGKGGTGKSTLINRIVSDCRNRGSACVVTAPYGLAADSIGGKTVSAHFGLEIDKIYDKQDHIRWSAISQDIKDADDIVIDEIGTLRADHALYVIRCIKQIEQVYNKRIQTIWSGDFSQLPPACNNRDMIKLRSMGYASEWIFDLPEWLAMMGRKIVLTHSYRHDGDQTLDIILTSIMCHKDTHAIEYLNEHCDRTADDDAIYIVPTRRIADEINAQKAAQFVNKTPITTQNGPLEIAVGMRVMTTANRGHKYQNGSMGVIKSINKKSIRVVFDKGQTVRVTPLDDGVYPIALAYALTVHKAQGQTFDVINITPGFFAAGQLYTALSRCKTLGGIHLLGDITMDDLIINRRAFEFQYGDMFNI